MSKRRIITIFSLLVILAGSFYILGTTKKLKDSNQYTQNLAQEVQKIDKQAENVDQQDSEFEKIGKLLDGEYKFKNIDISGWQSYQNKEMGFEIKIPSNMSCDKVIFPSGTLHWVGCMDKSFEKYRKAYFDGKYNGKVKFDVFLFAKSPKTDNLTMLDHASESSAENRIRPTYVVNVDGEPGIIFNPGQKKEMAHILLFKNDSMWNIDANFIYNHLDKDIFEEIMSSFKFMDS